MSTCSLFNYKAILSLTYAQTTTEDQILQVPQPAYGGFTQTVAERRDAGEQDLRGHPGPAPGRDGRV